METDHDKQHPSEAPQKIDVADAELPELVGDNVDDQDRKAQHQYVSAGQREGFKGLVPKKDLPAEVIEQILFLTDPETFASLVLVNRAWRMASETPQLYAYHLSRCPSFSASNNLVTGPFAAERLPGLKRQFVQEVKRNLFEAYLRPRQTIINIISTTTSSSAAFPGGEAFEFSFSPLGEWCLALSSARIFILDVASPVVSVRRELKVLRRPLSAALLDSGLRLAVLSTDHKVNLYDLSETRPRFLRSVSLDNPTHAIALSPKGEVLAAAYDSGVEVHSLAHQALATDQRAVKCDRVDSLIFSSDGTMLLGTTQASKEPNTVILSAPYFTDTDQDMPLDELISHMWTSQILFPNSSRDCSHATLLPHQPEGDASWTLTYDRVFESFRAVRTDDLRNGTTYFTGPKPTKSKQKRKSKSRLVPCTLPTITQRGELVAAGFLGNEVWMYGVPEGLDVPGNPSMEDEAPSTEPNSPIAGSSSPTTRTVEGSNPASERLPRWQVLVDKYRNVFAKGRRVAKISGITGMSWVGRPSGGDDPADIGERLVIVAPGGVNGSSELDQEELASVDGGRIVILDFDRTIDDGKSAEMTVEVGNVTPDMLEEENMDMATEIAIVRRRTVTHRRDAAARASLVDALRLTPGPGDVPGVPPVPQTESVGFGFDLPAPEAYAAEESFPPESPTEGLTLEEVAEALDGPYSHTHPRSRNTLYRSATAVEARRRRNPPIVPLSGHVEYRRTDGTELPHESDADNWVPPPPPYTPDPDPHLPAHLRTSAAPMQIASQGPPASTARRPLGPTRSQTTRENIFQQDVALRRRSSADIIPVPQMYRRSLWQRQSSEPPLSSPQDNISPLTGGGMSDGSIRDALTSPGALTPSNSRRRPVSSYENRSPVFRGALNSRPIQTVSTITEPARSNSANRRLSQSLSLQSRTSADFPPSHHLTLSGSNLQQRLDYPLPPPPAPETETKNIAAPPSPIQPPSPIPPTTVLTIESLPTPPPPPQAPPVPAPTANLIRNTVPQPSPYHSSSIRDPPPHAHRSSSSPLPITTTISPPILTPPSPTAYQLNNLQNRLSTYPPVPIPHPSTRFSTGPPRAALGAFGAPAPPIPSDSRIRSPYRVSQAINTEAPARRLSRGHSRSGSGDSGGPRSAEIDFGAREISMGRHPRVGSGGSWVASTPNLLRPSMGRLETIVSVASRGEEREEEVMVVGGGRVRTRSEGPGRRWRIRKERREELDRAGERDGGRKKEGKRERRCVVM